MSPPTPPRRRTQLAQVGKANESGSAPQLPERVAVVDDFAGFAASLEVGLQRVGVAKDMIDRYGSHDEAASQRDRLVHADLILLDFYRHESERLSDPYSSGVGALSVLRVLRALEAAPRVILYSSWANRPEVRLLAADLAVAALYSSESLLLNLLEVMHGDYQHAMARPGPLERSLVGVGENAKLIDAVDAAMTLGAETGEPYGDCWRFICDRELRNSRERDKDVPEWLRKAINRRLVPLLDLPPGSGYVAAVRVIQNLAQVGR